MRSQSPSQSSYVNGHDSLALGTTLGRLMHGQEQTIVILHRIDERLGQNGEAMVDVLKAMEVKLGQPPVQVPPPPTPKQERLTGKDWAQIILAAGLIAAALLGKAPVLEKVVPLIVK